MRVAVLDRHASGECSVRTVLPVTLVVEETYNPFGRQLVRYAPAAKAPIRIVSAPDSKDVIYEGDFRPYVRQLARDVERVVERWRYTPGSTFYSVERPRIVEWVDRGALRRVHFEIRDDSLRAVRAPSLEIQFGDGAVYASSADESPFNMFNSLGYLPITQEHEYQHDGRYDVVVTVTSHGPGPTDVATRFHKTIRVDSSLDPRTLRQEDYFALWPLQRESARSASEIEAALRAWFPGAL